MVKRLQTPKIGLKIGSALYNGPNKVDSNVVEIIPKDLDFQFNRKTLDKFKKALSGKERSMHTSTKRVFTETDKKLRELEILILRAEILASEYLGCQELIVHLTQEKLRKTEIKQFEEILRFAKRHNVEIIYEMNKKFNGKNFLYNLSQFPKLKVNLDIGHLNTAIINKTLKIPVADFIKKINQRIVYLHLHNNEGEDEHKSLEEGSLDWRSVLNQVDLSKVRKIILELRDYQKMHGDAKLIKEYLKERVKCNKK
jgi:sugar phosphate isomerase/epimerase